MGVPWSKMNTNDYSIFFGCGITLVIEGVTLVRVLRGSKHRFVIKILVMLVGYNLAKLASVTVYLCSKQISQTRKWEIIRGFDSTAYLLFNVSHWMFASKYFTIARHTPYKVAKQEVPREMVKCDKITNWVFLTLNSIPPILFGVSNIGYYIAESNGNSNTELAEILAQLVTISLLAMFFVPITSGIYLFMALF